tara:strand:+ start:46 stop:1587 length:1542 start_codon:yes stop_codon:yes gene_type:complete
MIKNDENLLENISESLADEKIQLGYFGIEKESLRVFNNQISKSPHKDLLGSPLCNNFITTDFSDALVEIITPPFSNKNDGYQFLDDIHHYVSINIKKETLWPFSMPPLVNSEKDIEIAKYGESNQGRFKVLYRNGLSNRYGRIMQSIAGLHFNYSFSPLFWELPFFHKYGLSTRELKECIYFRTLRNIQRMNWLILYFFGASPVVSKNFIDRGLEGFKQIEDAYYIENSTSLRMSELGYQPTSQANLKISIDTMDDYIHDLLRATETNSKSFNKLFLGSQGNNAQINSNILQIEDEYYSVARPKSSSTSYQRLTSKLINYGVDYIELRSLDLNPFCRTGLEKGTVEFLEVFIALCAFMPSPKISQSELKAIKHNDNIVSMRGREEGLCLRKNDSDILLKDWANEILYNMRKAANLFFENNLMFKEYEDKIHNPDETLSGKILSSMRLKKMGFHELGDSYTNKYKEEYLGIPRAQNKNWLKIENEKKGSIRKQLDIERADSGSFKKYTENYFQS